MGIMEIYGYQTSYEDARNPTFVIDGKTYGLDPNGYRYEGFCVIKWNPKSDYKAEKIFGQTVYRVGDKVMQTKNNYDIQFDQIVNSFNVVNDINFFISNDKSFKQESTIAKYYIIEKLQQKLLNKNLDFDILSFLFLPTNIQTAYMLTEYQLQLDKFAAGYESYQDFTHNNHITKDHNWLALYYKLLDSNEFMVFIQTEQLIPNFAKTARKITLITAMCNIGELDYEFEVGHPTNGKKDKDIYSLKFGKLQIFGNLPIQNGKQIILEIENSLAK